MHKLLGMALSTNNPKAMKEILIPSLKYARELVNVCTWLINFQPPYTLSDIEEVQNAFGNYGFKCISTLHTYDMSESYNGLVPLSKIRNDTARLMKDAQFYCLIDDDMAFKGPTEKCDKTGGLQYLDGLTYMITHPKCGIMLFRNRRRSVPMHEIRPVEITEPYYTGRGMIVRNVDECYMTPTNSEWVLGGDEENIIAGARLIKGLYPAELHGCRVYHHEHRGKLKKSGQEVYGWYNYEVLKDNATKYIQENFNPEFKGSQAICGGVDDPNVVRYEDYIKAGGLDIKDPNIKALITKDYSASSVKEDLEVIRKLY